MHFVNRIKRYWNLFSTTNVLKTIYFNFKMFPFNVAIKHPIHLAYGVEIIGAKRGVIVLDKIKSGGVKIGYLKYPMHPGKGMGTLIRIGSGNARLYLGGEDINIYKGCSIILAYPESKLSIGNDTLINQGVMLYCSNSVTIGEHFSCGWDSQIYDSNFHYVFDEQNHTIANRTRPVKIGRNVWIANHVTVATGAQIPSYSIIAANSVINKDYSEITTKGNFFAGSPAKLKRTGLFRILNLKFEYELNAFFRENGEISYKCTHVFDYNNYATR